jgi:NADH-quinone oxidoreductase subunit L
VTGVQTCALPISTLAIAGFPFTAGFFSKDAILWSVFSGKTLISEFAIFDILLTKILFWAALATAFLTAIYMLRSVVLIFVKPNSGAVENAAPCCGAVANNSVSRSSRIFQLTMLIPTLILGLLSVVFGLVAGDWLMKFLNGEYPIIEESFEILSGSVAVVGIVATALVYFYYRGSIDKLVRVKLFSGVYKVLCNKWYVDELYDRLIVKPLEILSRVFQFVDKFVIDGLLQIVTTVVSLAAETLRGLQTGKISFYLASLFVANIVLLAVILILL